MTRISRWLCCALLCAAGSGLAGAVESDDSRPLTLGECLRRALARGFDMELGRNELEIVHENVPIARSEFHPVFSAGAGTSAFHRAAEAATPGLNSDGLETRVGLSQRLRSGTLLSLSGDLIRSTSNVDQSLDAIRPYTSGLTLSVTQPLMRGRGWVNTIPLRLAELGVDVAERRYEDRALDVVLATERAYYVLVGARDQRDVFRSSLQLAETLLKEAQARHRAGMATKLDLLQGEVGVANARLGLLQAENAVKASEDALLALIGQFELDTPPGP